MRVKTIQNNLILLVLIFSFTAVAAIAQPSADRLAEEMINKYEESLSQIETLSMTIQVNEGGLIPDMTTRYVKKTNENGTPYLDLENEDDMEMDFSAMAGSVDQMVDLIRGAESISEEKINGVDTYKIYVNDSELLKSLDQGEMEMEDTEIEFDSATFWIETGSMNVRKIFMEQTVDGEKNMNVEMNLDDYRDFSGYPVAMSMTMKIGGMSSQFSEEEIAEAREAMREMEKQLSQMPEAQRAAIERQIKPQMEQFERMLESDEGMTMNISVKDVKVNE
ncbi:hypothetical protein [Rhodohalobacter sp.]|uniref:hypothetical protein n=1 Tax=Rhodohalobacter sp. TaxID=1974210 RepID=UPI002ACE87F6|nr:hypothetical protein [Rhodohalobacter sp.]MDZ7757036.1 hypothetical protein [Rhodohalobacter sp.]